MAISKVTADDLIRQLRQSIKDGENWYNAFLEMASVWNIESETVGATKFQYIIDGEALDLSAIAARALPAISDLIDGEILDKYLTTGDYLGGHTYSEMRSLLGEDNYVRYLNFFYGVTLEEILHQLYKEALHKDHLSTGYTDKVDVTPQIFIQIYNQSRETLFSKFCEEKGYIIADAMNSRAIKEFYYWLFKQRVKNQEPARVASDTKRALDWLEKYRRS